MGALAVCAFLTYFFAGSGVFSVRTVQAVGVSAKDLAAIQQRCGCIGDNIFVVRPEDIKRRLQTIPTLEVERIYTRLPNKVIVEARPKSPVAIWRTPEAAYAVDAASEVLRVWKRPFRTGWRLPVFDEGYDGGFERGHRLLVGQYLPQDDPLAFALTLRAAMPSDMQLLIKRYLYRRALGITVEGNAGWWVLFSPDDDNLQLRIQAMRQELQNGGLQPRGCFDVRGPLDGRRQYTRKDHSCGT